MYGRRKLSWVATAMALGIVAWGLYVAWPRRMIAVKSTLTGKTYVVKNQEGAQDVADRLATMELKIRDFLHRADKYAPGDPRLANIHARWNGTLQETVDDTDVAFSVGKDAISVCVRSLDGTLESENTCMFVLLHELAHVATNGYGHHPEFWANMRFLLEVAEMTGSYRYEDFDSTEVTYCGRRLSGSPLTCVKRGSCASQLSNKK